MTATIYPGRVVGLDAQGPLVLVSQLALSAPFGPLPTLVADLAVGEQVAVTNMGGTRDQLIVLGRMAGRTPTIEEIPGLDARLDADEATITAQGGRLSTAEGTITSQGTRLTTAEGTITSQGTRLTTAEGTIGTQGTRLTATEGVANAAATATAVATLRADTAGKATAKGQILIATASGVLGAHAVPADGLALVADAAQGDGWAAKDVLGMPKALTGATSATRYVGATTGGAPASGTFAVGDFVVDRNTGETWVCTAAGTPGTWVSALAALRTAVFGGPTRTAAPACTLIMSAADRVLVASTDTYQDAQWAVGSDPEGLWHAGSQPTGGYIQVPIAGRYDVEHLALMGGIANAFNICRVVLNTISAGSFVASDVRQTPSGLGEPFYVRARLIERTLAANDKLYFAVWSSGASTVYKQWFTGGPMRTSVALSWVGPT